MTRNGQLHRPGRSALLSGRPKSRPCWATRPRRAKNSAGHRKSRFAELVAEMMREDLKAGRARRTDQEARLQGHRPARMMDRSAKIYVAGHRGMVGSALVRRLQSGGYTNSCPDPHARANSTFEPGGDGGVSQTGKADLRLHRGGQGWRHPRQQHLPADFIYQNLMVEANLIHGAWLAGIQAPVFPRIELHLSARLPATDQGGIPC
jgi:hypothetical protein